MSKRLVTAILFDSSLALEWEETALPDNHGRQRLEKLLLDSHKKRDSGSQALWLLVLGLSDTTVPISPSLAFWREFACAWVHQARTMPETEEARENLQVPLNQGDGESFLERVPPMVGIDSIGLPYLSMLWNSLTLTFQNGIRGFKGSVEDYFSSLAPIPLHIDRIHFHLVENRRNKQRPFAFLATYSTRVDEQGHTRHQPLKFALEEYGNRSDKLLELLATVNRVAKRNTFIASLVESGELFHPVALSTQEALAFLNGLPDFEAAGILCRIPNWWKGGPKRASVVLSVGGRQPSHIGFKALLD